MTKIQNQLLGIIATLFLSQTIFGQEPKLAKADNSFNQYAYVDAIKTYGRMFDKGYRSPELLQKLSDAYYFKADLPNAARYYKELFALGGDLEPEYYYRYAQSLKSVKEYDKANEMMELFVSKNQGDSRASLAVSQRDYLSQIKKNSGRYTLSDAGVNTRYSDYGSAFFGNSVIFASARDTAGSSKNIAGWTGESYTNLYQAYSDQDGSLGSAKRFNKAINSRYHESTPVFTKDGKTVYFTRNNYLDGKKGKDSKKTILLKLYKATLEGETWKDIQELPFNSNEYSVAHPAMSPDEQRLYFASNMPGTIGQSDLFMVSINSDGSYGNPENLGKEINTEGRETFPMITAENELYFASDGHPGLGGLDVFEATSSNGIFGKVSNVGEPVNSSKDDFGFLLDNATGIGYVSSNREGGRGNDDIYKLKAIPVPVCEQELVVTLNNQLTNEPITNGKVSLYDQNFLSLKEVAADASGNYNFGMVDCGSKYYLRSQVDRYNGREVATTIATTSGKTKLPIALEQTQTEIKPGDDLAKNFGIKMIYFDLDKSKIRQDAAFELAKILDVLEQNPGVSLDIRSHTDSRQSETYNNNLSERRAKATLQWLVNKGISKDRLTAKGYGESQLLNACGDGANCSEEEHQANRRSEFIITKT